MRNCHESHEVLMEKRVYYECRGKVKIGFRGG